MSSLNSDIPGEATAHGRLEFEFAFESYGVPVRIRTSSAELLDEARKTARIALVGNLGHVSSTRDMQTFEIFANELGTLFLNQNGERITEGDLRGRFFKFFNSILRIAVAEHAIERVFVHAGVVSWKDRAILIPGDSFSGKTTLVTELVKAGAIYYSDEYAVIDREGLVDPFPRDLSVRFDDNGTLGEKDVAVSSIGGVVGVDPVRIGMVVLTRYSEGATWSPEDLSVGRGMLEVIPHTIPRNSNAEFSLKVLNTAVSDAIILKSARGEAATFVPEILSFLTNL